MHAAKRQAELGRRQHQGALIAASRFADHGAAALRPGSTQGFGDGGDRVGDPQARPAVSAMSSQSFETSTPMHNGPATAERSVEALAGDELPWRTFRKKGKVLWRRIVTRGGPGLPFALKTEKGRTTDRDCLRTRVPSRIDLAVLPAILTADEKNSPSKRTIQGT
jgi:hypothetical protein